MWASMNYISPIVPFLIYYFNSITVYCTFHRSRRFKNFLLIGN